MDKHRTARRPGVADEPDKPDAPGSPGTPESTPWWRIRMLWLVIGGPLVVVIASFATLVLALRYPDPVLATPAAASPAEMPAVQGRNHAAAPQR